jgi:hypothetical protein
MSFVRYNKVLFFLILNVFSNIKLSERREEMTRKNEEEIQEIISWIKKKSPEPWEVLFKVATEHPELMRIKLGQLLVVKWGIRDLFADAWARANRRVYSPRTKNTGGELLTRLPMSIVRAACDIGEMAIGDFIGESFDKMPIDKSMEMSAFLIGSQLKYISNLRRNHFYSINIEAPTHNSTDWQKVITVLSGKEMPNVRLELIERRQFPIFVLRQLAGICESTGMGIYIDDLGSDAHSLPENEEYICQILKYLGRYIVAVKLDYKIVSEMVPNDKKGNTAAARVVSNIFYFTRLWQRVLPGLSPCGIIFESMPCNERGWLLNVQKICQIFFRQVYWQVD